jgi:hypothetical protein
MPVMSAVPAVSVPATLVRFAIPERVSHDGHVYQVTTIGEGAFAGKTIGRVLVPKFISSIKKGAFSKCNLQELTFEDGSNLAVIDQDFFGKVRLGALGYQEM